MLPRIAMSSEGVSKTELLEHRHERDLMQEGKSVLEERRDLLAHLILAQTARAEELMDERDEIFQLTREHVRAAIMRHGIQGLTRFAATGSGGMESAWLVSNRLGVHWLEPTESPTPTPRELPDSWEVSLELEASLALVHGLFRVLTELAGVETNLLRLITAFRTTQRRVNALDHVLLPQVSQTIRRMEETMDEMERDDLVRSLLIKRRQAVMG